MFPKNQPTGLPSWQALSSHYSELKDKNIKSFFDANANRVAEFSLVKCGLYLDYSKNLIDEKGMKLLMGLARESHLDAARKAMEAGEKINERENRAVLHHALRSSRDSVLMDEENVMPLVNGELAKIETIANAITSGEWKGHTGKKIRYVVNIGIGGSDLGPQMVCNALKPFWSDITPYFLSNIDAAQWEEISQEVKAEETVFIVASKTFTTDETMTNARTVRSWFIDRMGTDDALKKHFFAVSSNIPEVKNFGIPEQNIVGFWDWVGGRFSLWSSIGLSIALAVGFERFKELLEGAGAMDEHFFSAEMEENMPVVMALLTIWQVNFCGQTNHAILPYDHRLRDFPRFLQQMIMEINGKQVDRNGNRISYPTCPVYFGEPGTNGQHAFYQLLHQGTEIVPSDFIAVAKPAHTHEEHHTKLLANCFAQSEALMDGSSNEDPFRNFEGNRPSNTLLMDELT
ncbi:MAG: glucose-6-phosphate isomerase, partial [Cyclobacteriaceae bacterium]